MTKIVQLSGGTRETQDLYTGPEREVTVDESNWNLRLHDGSTPGGREILSKDNADQDYQARSTELDGLLDFTPQQRGFLARLGPADYRLRSLTVNGASLTLTNGNGYSGNPLVELAADVTSDHVFSGEITFSQVILGTGGFTGDVTGDVTGNLTGDSAGTHTGSVIGDAAGNHTGTFTGDVDVSGGNITFADGQIPLSALADDILTYVALAGVPVGGIICYSGAIVDIPEPWLLCDGTNGTPDLRNRFIIGAGDDYDVDDFGGSDSFTPSLVLSVSGAHTHSVTIAPHTLTTAEIPTHKHGNGVVDKNDNLFNHGGLVAAPAMGDSIDGNSSNGTREGYTTEVGGGAAHTHAGSDTSSNGDHTHIVTGESGAALPPYYALAYIMKGS